MEIVSRRLLATTAAGSLAGAATKAAAQTFGNPDRPAQGAINATNPQSITDPGPQNPTLASQFPSAQSPPPTDVDGMAMPWASFNNAPRRIQNGGWARQVTQADFAISEEISGVPGDIGYVKRSHGHYILNTGDTDLVFLEVFRSSYFADVSLSDWLTRTPPELVAQHLNVDPATIAKFPKNKPEIMPQ
jgi:oxalate decarboxylase